MKNVVLFLVFGLCWSATYSQNISQYRKLILHGVEAQTNGKDTIYIVDPMPQFPGGRSAMVEFLKQNIYYPVSARRDHIEGEVLVTFVVDKTGVIRNVVIKKGVREDLDNEAIRVMQIMPKWSPGKIKGVPVSVKYTIPIHFHLSN